MSFRINFTEHTEVLFILLPGISYKIGIGVLQAIEARLIDSHSNYLTVTFPFQDKGFDMPESKTHDLEMMEVVRGVKKASEGVRFGRVVLLGKSFGGLIAIKLLSALKEHCKCPFDLHILGYIFDESMRMDADVVEHVFIYQGEHDRFGSPEKVAQTVPFAKVFSIAGADHSYRNELKEPVYESEVARLFFNVVAP